MKSKAVQPEQDPSKTPVTTPVAIIGLASLFPQANNLEEYWDNIVKKVDAVVDVPPSRWNIADYYDPNPSAPDKTYCKRGGFIPDIDFDPLEFGLPPNILEVTDVSQLISLVVAKEALEDAGYGEGREWNRAMAGVILGFVGMGSKLYNPLMNRLQYPVWEKVLRSFGVADPDIKNIVEKIKLAYTGWEENSFPGAIGNVVAGRIANRFDLGGVNCVVDAACGSSLAAVKMAYNELITGRADLMITGGVDVDNSIGAYMCFSKTPAFTKADHVQTFDAESGGMMVGEGLGMLVLKRLADAERDGDRIYAVIKGLGSSSDGRFKSIYAPRPAGQALALRRAYQEAGFSPATVGLVEAHGTGTMAGDPAEVQSLTEVYLEANAGLQTVALGSVKSQIAHTKGAAGAASLIKTALALHHKVLPPTINVNRPNPKLDIEHTPLYINTENRPWIRPAGGPPRRAAVSSFGFGGTNYHVVLEEYQSEHTSAYRLNKTAQPVLLSSPDLAGLITRCQQEIESLRGLQAVEHFSELVKKSQSTSIHAGDARLGFVASTQAEAIQAIELSLSMFQDKPQADTWEHPKGVFFRRKALSSDGRVVALFSGQGSQYVDMGRDLATSFPLIRETFGAMDGLFLQDGLEPLSRKIYPPPAFDQPTKDAQNKNLTRTEHAQPAIGSFSIGLYKLLQAAGLQADYTAGHSFGELIALWAGGVYSEEDAMTLAKARGKAMAAPDDPNFDAGTMLAVKGDIQKIAEEIKAFPEITLANYNSNNQAVLAGAKTEIARVKDALAAKGYSVVSLPVSAAFHTPLVGHAQKPFAKTVDSVKFQASRIPVFSNTTGKPYPAEPSAMREILKSHILKPVLFKDEIQAIHAQGGFYFIEFGPKNVLTNLVKNILEGQPHFAIALNGNANQDSDRQFREAYIQLRVAGLNLAGIDPYPVNRVKVAKKKSPVTVTLTGGLYQTEKSRKAWEDGLLGNRLEATLKGLAPTVPAQVSSQPATQPVAAPVLSAVQPVATSTTAASTVQPVAFEHLERSLELIQEHEKQVAHLHEQYLSQQSEYAHSFSQLVQLGFTGGGAQSSAAFESLERSLARFHDHQQETLKIHAQYMAAQQEFTLNLFSLARQLPASGPVSTPAPRPVIQAPLLPAAVPQPVFVPPPAAPVPVSTVSIPKPSNGNGHGAAPAVPPPSTVVTPAAPASVSLESLSKALFQVVAEKTGYPVDMLEASMDMEADLGIDSIKRVEILGAMQSLFPQLPPADNAALAETRTLGQIVQHLNSSLPAASQAAEPAAPTPASTPAVSSAPSTAGAPPDLLKALLAIVAEKTGYPADMIEPGMDMEADLGIDSIKRVEILGAMQAQFPGVAVPDNQELADLRTLGQIVEKMSPPASPVSSPPPPPTEPGSAAHAPAPDSSNGAVSVDVLTKALLGVVAEKTGYPADMLEMSMDMEADLGIDSIKRVEILGAIQSLFPQLPPADNAALSETRTLGQIVDLLNSPAATEAPASMKEVGPSPSPFDIDLPRGRVRLKPLPRPDSVAQDLPAGTLCLVTDDGTPVAAGLATALVSQGLKVVLLGYPQDLLPTGKVTPAGVIREELKDVSETALTEILQAVQTDHGPVGLYIHLNPCVPVEPGMLFSDAGKTWGRLAFLTAKHLKEPLNRLAVGNRAAFIAVTHLDGSFGLEGSSCSDPSSGGLFGLVKSLNLEWDGVFCRAIDISPEFSTQQSVEAILAELADPNRLVAEVAYNPSGRFTLAIDSDLVLEGS